MVFGSEGTAQADFERMEEINREIGLSAMIQVGTAGSDIVDPEKDTEKANIETV